MSKKKLQPKAMLNPRKHATIGIVFSTVSNMCKDSVNLIVIFSEITTYIRIDT